MLRRLLALLILLLVAMAINVAVAWGAVWLFARTAAAQTMQVQSSLPMMPSNDASQFWQEEFGPSLFVASFADADRVTTAPTSPGLGSHVFWLRETNRNGFGCSNLSMSDELHQAPIALEVLRAGWPLPALGCERVFGPKKYQVKHAWMAFSNNGTRAGGMILPCKPMWTGAIVNTIFYAGLLMLLWFGVVRGRRALRRHATRCVACGYDLRAATGNICPECGLRQ